MYVDEKKSTYQIADALRVSSKFVGKWCRRYGFPMRPFCSVQKISDDVLKSIYDRYRNGESGESIMGDTGYSYCTIKKAVTKYGGTLRSPREAARRKYTMKHDYFHTIDTPMKAYFLGFLAADGCMTNPQKSNVSRYVRLSIQERDREIVEKLARELETDAPLRRTHSSYKGGSFWFVDLQMNSVQMYEDLEMHGLHPGKSWTLKPPYGVPDELLHDFVRGFFDGDGCVATTKPPVPLQVQFCGTPEMMTWLTQVFDRWCGVKPNKVSMRTDRFAILNNSGSKAVKIRDFMYPTRTEFGLSRKKTKLFSIAP
jgi:hypothetical protein